MQKNDKFYTFLLSHSSRSKIYIKRVAISKSLVHFGSVGIFLVLGLTTLGIGVSGVVRNTVFAQSVSNIPVTTQMTAQTAPAAEPAQPAADAFTFNSGGPEEIDGFDGETSEIESEMREIRATLDPAFLPSVWPHQGKINNEFGFRRNPFGGRSYEFHAGMDIDGERGDLVIAPAGGTVIKASWSGGYGNMLEIDHGNGLTTRYGHLSKIEVGVGDQITRGQLVAYVGSTGRSTGPHLHYELRLNDKSINPRHVLPQESPTVPVK
ncbi:MAG TPA: M23 family metallopeptidase [Pyrinomonadaceae bacterium]|nr:M23 family metallopeptidase [Pyrinomonadaceae bacterium]